MGWVLRLVVTGGDGASRSVDVVEIVRAGGLGDLAGPDLSLVGGKQLVPQVQQAVVAAQSRTMPPGGRRAGPAPPSAKSGTTGPTGLRPRSARLRSGCPASVAPAAAGRRVVSIGRPMPLGARARPAAGPSIGAHALSDRRRPA